MTDQQEQAILNAAGRFPFANVPSEVIGGEIMKIDRMLRAIVRERLPRRHRAEREDVQQNLRMALVQAIPRYDTTRGAVMSSFLFGVIQRTMSDELERLDRGRRPSTSTDALRFVAAPDTASDRAVESLAESIIEQPHDYLTDLGASIVKAVVENPGTPRGAIADSLGLSPDRLSKNLHKAKKRLKNFVEAKSPAN